MKKICFLAAVPQSLQLFLSDIIKQSSHTYSVTVVSHPKGADILKDLNASYVPILIERKPSPLKDLISLFKIVKLFRREKFSLVHSITPKTGLLTMFAAFVSRVPVRIHTFTGQVWLNMKGCQRTIFKLLDKLLVLCSTHILVDSPSQRDFLVREGILKPGQAIVFGHGSICGVDTNAFKFSLEDRFSIRSSLNLDKDAIVILFMARLTKQKGILELAEAFNILASLNEKIYLYVIGAEEDVTFNEVLNICHSYKDRVIRLNYTEKPASYLSAADVLCLPSHMEGFGQVLINASACGLPIVATRIYGITDAVEDGVTGLLYPAGDVDGLSKTLMRLIKNKKLREELGAAGKERVLNYFDQKLITQCTVNFYKQQLNLQ